MKQGAHDPTSLLRSYEAEGSGNGAAMADAECGGQSGQREFINAVDSAEAGNREATESVDGSESCIWLPEPGVGRVANGIPRRVDRLKGLGNAIVPQVAYELLMEIRKLL